MRHDAAAHRRRAAKKACTDAHATAHQRQGFSLRESGIRICFARIIRIPDHPHLLAMKRRCRKKMNGGNGKKQQGRRFLRCVEKHHMRCFLRSSFVASCGGVLALLAKLRTVPQRHRRGSLPVAHGRRARVGGDAQIFLPLPRPPAGRAARARVCPGRSPGRVEHSNPPPPPALWPAPPPPGRVFMPGVRAWRWRAGLQLGIGWGALWCQISILTGF